MRSSNSVVPGDRVLAALSGGAILNNHKVCLYFGLNRLVQPSVLQIQVLPPKLCSTSFSKCTTRTGIDWSVVKLPTISKPSISLRQAYSHHLHAVKQLQDNHKTKLQRVL